jgi:hypothetical protein
MSEKIPKHVDPRSKAAKTLQEFPYFTARDSGEVTNVSGAGDVGVFQHDANGSEKQIGSFYRNYSFLRTFCWFRRGKRHFALYSPDCGATRVMEISPDDGFKDLGGEESDANGFCPVDFFVPDCREYVSQNFTGPGEQIVDWNNPLDSLPTGCEFTKNSKTHRGRRILRREDGSPVCTERSIGNINGVEQTVKQCEWGEEGDFESGWIKFPPDHGFVAGCLWGDDTSWKIQYLDLSRAGEGIIRRDDRFGYIELPESVALRDAIHIEDMLENPTVYIAISTEWDLHTGKMEPLHRHTS